jgi:hypothetical protein
MNKRFDPFSPPFPCWHQTTIGRLKSILENGLLSKNEASKLEIKGYKRNFKSSWNDDSVSLMANTSPSEATAPTIAILIDSKKVKTIKATHDNQDKNQPVPEEVLVKDKIPPEKFIGIVIGEVGYSFKLEKFVKPRPLNRNKVIEIIKSSQKNSLPVYFKGEKIWPKED